jgi:glutathione S-transferase
MAVKLHTCGWTWFKVDGLHSCYTVRKALDEKGVSYELVKHPTMPRGRRTAIKEMTGQDRLPVLELEDGRVIREESKDVAAKIRAGELP